MAQSSRTCTYTDCERPFYAKELCEPHYQRQRMGQDMDAHIVTRRRPHRTCRLSDCKSPNYARGFCSLHYTRLRRGLSLHSPRRRRYTKDKPCRHPGCAAPVARLGYCSIHHSRLKAGRPLGDPFKTINVGKQCGACNERDAVTKGLCRRCYMRQWSRAKARLKTGAGQRGVDQE